LKHFSSERVQSHPCLMSSVKKNHEDPPYVIFSNVLSLSLSDTNIHISNFHNNINNSAVRHTTGP
jgi:hypothetical protein